MRKLVKALSLATVLVLVAGMAMAGCATPKPAPTAAPVATPEPAIDTSQEVHLYGYLLGAALPGMQDVMDALNEKLKADINATMEVNYIGWGDLQAKYPLILAAGENVDWIYTAAWCQYPTQAAKGAFMEMTPEIYAKYMPLHWAKLKDTSALKECSIDGKDYMIPTATPDKKVPVALYRKDLADKYGIPAITKFSDIEPYLAAIKANEPDMIPMNLDNTYDLGTPDGNLVTESSDIYTDILMITGSGCGLVYKPFGTDGKLMLPTDPDLLPVYTKAAKTVKSWYDAGYINHDAFANKVRSKEALVQGKTAVAFGNSIDVQGNLTQCAAAGMDIGIIPILSGANGKSPANAFTNNGIAISAKSKNWERALMAMDLVMEDPAYDNLCYYGVEGKHYVLTSDGKIDYPDTIDQSAYPIDQAGFWFVNKDLFKPLTTWTPGYIELQGQLPGMLQTDLLAAFSVNTDNIKTEAANCNQVLVQYNNPIVLGAVEDVDAAYAELGQKLKEAGVEKIKTELTAQIQAYLASLK
jgi:putative aldouronate transport system substrate-binding protein